MLVLAYLRKGETLVSPAAGFGAARRGARKKAEWIWGVLAKLERSGLAVLADKGYRGSGYAKIG